MLRRSLRRICGVSLADRIHNEEIHRMIITSEDVTAKKIYDGKLSGTRGKGDLG